ncbi:MAG: PorV/PorQ family protein [Bacteroidales bacterium]|nr:PorV/PorQ family protein [Bacteroidales bacterium]
MNLKTKVVIIIIFAANSLFAQVAPKYSNEFLAIGVGGRALAMGNSVVASVDDISSVYWNPAGLTKLDKQMEIGAMHSEYFAGVAKFDFIGASYKIDDKSAAGISMIRFGVDDIPNTLDLVDSDGNIRYDRISSFSVADYAFLFSYARVLPIEGLSVGGNVKLIRRNAGDFANAWGFGFDVSAMYQTGNFSFGANLRDATSTFNAWKFNQDLLRDVFEATGNEVPENGLELTLPRLLLGAGYDFKITDKFNLYSEIGLNTTTDGKRNTLIKTDLISIDPSFGVELGYSDIVFARAGVNNFQQIPEFDGTNDFSWQPNIGVGIKYFGFRLDYALTDIGNQSIALYSHIFSLSYTFNSSSLFAKPDQPSYN